MHPWPQSRTEQSYFAGNPDEIGHMTRTGKGQRELHSGELAVQRRIITRTFGGFDLPLH